jgi:hypothetical protein
MLRWSFLILASAASLAAQIRWTCDAKDGKFAMTPCATCQKFYCWDGQIFSEEPGYTPPPSYVLCYWEEAHRRSQQIRADVDRKGKELGEQVQKASQETMRLNQERNQAHKEYMDDLNRRINESRSSQGAPHSGMGANNQRAVPKDVVVAASGPNTSIRSIPPSSRVRASEVAVPGDLVVVATGSSTSVPNIPPCSRSEGERGQGGHGSTGGGGDAGETAFSDFHS